jgi:hypothetical protein
MDAEKIRAEIKGRAKPEDVRISEANIKVISIENLNAKLLEGISSLNGLSSTRQIQIKEPQAKEVNRPYIKKLLSLLETRKIEYEIKVDDTVDDFAYLNSKDESTILEPFFISLRD